MITIKLKRYLAYLLEYFSDVSIIDNMIIKNGLRISIGWNLGKKNISIHLLEPLTSTPKIGTKISVKNIIMKDAIDNLKKVFSSRKEKKKIVNIPSKV